MRKIITLLLIIASMLSLVACSDDYPEIKSTDEESRVVMTVKYDEKTYEIKYELYRALFIALRQTVDNGDASVWSGEDKDKYVEKIDALIKERISEIYSIFHIASKAGIDVYSKEYNDTVKNIIALSVEGGEFEETEISGFGGDYDKYLEHLKEQGINYAVQDLLIRYWIASEQIYTYYAGNLSTEEHIDNIVSGNIKYTEEDVYNFYNSENCVRVIRAFLSDKFFSEKRVGEIHSEIIERAKKGENEVANYIIGISTAGATDIKNGEVIAMHNLDRQYYSELINYAFTIPTFEVSPVIKVETGYENGYIIIYKTVKSNLHFEECYEQIEAVYLQNEVGKIIDTAADSIKNGLTETDVLKNLDRSLISID